MQTHFWRESFSLIIKYNNKSEITNITSFMFRPGINQIKIYYDHFWQSEVFYLAKLFWNSKITEVNFTKSWNTLGTNNDLNILQFIKFINSSRGHEQLLHYWTSLFNGPLGVTKYSEWKLCFLSDCKVWNFLYFPFKHPLKKLR